MINILLKISLFSPRFCESVPGEAQICVKSWSRIQRMFVKLVILIMFVIKTLFICLFIYLSKSCTFGISHQQN